MIFDQPLLATVEHTVAGKTLTLYELSADLYYDHVLNPAALQRWDMLSKNEGVETEPDYQQLHEARKADKESQLDWVTCSLLPGYPNETFEALRTELKSKLSIKQLSAMYTKAYALGAEELAKKPESPDDGSSTD